MKRSEANTLCGVVKHRYWSTSEQATEYSIVLEVVDLFPNKTLIQYACEGIMTGLIDDLFILML